LKRTLPLLLALCMLVATPALALRIASTKITHLEQVYQAYAGSSLGNNPCFYGYLGTASDTISSTPGILCIVPGGDTWPNFVGAAQEEEPVEYTIKNVSLVKDCPEYVQCADVFPPLTVSQQGTSNIRLWWPLMYEPPSCTYTLTILYGTPVLYDDDGAGPNPAAWVHVEEWVWHVDADLSSLSLLLELFHEIPFGKDEVPLISDEPLYDELQLKIVAAALAFDMGDLVTAALILADFELEVMDACIEVSPAYPNPTGPGTGIANTDENPACCKLLIDVEYILQTLGIGQPGK